MCIHIIIYSMAKKIKIKEIFGFLHRAERYGTYEKHLELKDKLHSLEFIKTLTTLLKILFFNFYQEHSLDQ